MDSSGTVARRQDELGAEQAIRTRLIGEHIPNMDEIAAIQAYSMQAAEGIESFTFAMKRPTLAVLEIAAVVTRGERRAHGQVTLTGYIPKSDLAIPDPIVTTISGCSSHKNRVPFTLKLTDLAPSH